jgi:hypothetical protein
MQKIFAEKQYGCGYVKNATMTTVGIYNMKKKDLLQLIAHMSDEDEVVVTLKQSGVGDHALRFLLLVTDLIGIMGRYFSQPKLP